MEGRDFCRCEGTNPQTIPLRERAPCARLIAASLAPPFSEEGLGESGSRHNRPRETHSYHVSLRVRAARVMPDAGTTATTQTSTAALDLAMIRAAFLGVEQNGQPVVTLITPAARGSTGTDYAPSRTISAAPTPIPAALPHQPTHRHRSGRGARRDNISQRRRSREIASGANDHMTFAVPAPSGAHSSSR